MTSFSRRNFMMAGGVLALGSALLPKDVMAQTGQQSSLPPEPKRPAPLDDAVVKEFVGISHRNLDKVKTMLETEPKLVNATWDWGGGDWETALGAASHMGRRDIAEFLLVHGARKDVFCAAMLGEMDIVKTWIMADAAVAKLQGPHGIPLFFHAVLSGEVAMVEMIQKYDGGKGYDRSLGWATDLGHKEMVAWLLVNGVKDVNKRFRKKTPLDNAIAKGYSEIADLLRKHGGVVSGS